MSASNSRKSLFARSLARVLLGLAAAVFLSSAWAQNTDISLSPLFTTQANAVKPNLLFNLDDSGSMAWDFMPDEVKPSTSNASNGLASGAYGVLSSQCNGVAYNPYYKYVPPVNAAGASYPDANVTPSATTFTAALNDGFNASSGTTDLTGRYYYAYTTNTAVAGWQPAMSWTFTTTGAITTTPFFQQCNSLPGATPGSTYFTKVPVTSTSGPGGTDERGNYANWYSYYRTRILMMKTAVGLAFKPIDANYRVGFTTIHSMLPILNVSDFNATQKASFYNSFYAATPGNSTPLRGAISRSGQYYAHKAPGQTADPVQYSCQHNYTLMSTDGYWNTGNDVSNGGASGNYGPYKMDNTTQVGQQDGGSTPRPFYDGEQITSTQKYTWNQLATTVTTTLTPNTVVSTSTASTTTSTPKGSATRNHNTSAGNTTPTLTITSITRPSSGFTNPVTITVQTSVAHGIAVGNSVSFSGLPAGYASPVTVLTVPSTTTFTYKQSFSSRPTSYSSGATVVNGTPPAGVCPNGQAYMTTQPQKASIYGNVKNSQITTTTGTYTQTKTVTSYVTTTFTETIITVNGAVASDTTSSTSANTPAATTTTTNGPTTTTTSVGPMTPSTLADSTGTFSNSGSATTGTTCVLVSSLPSDTGLTTNSTVLPGATPFTTTNATVTNGPNTTAGASTSSASTTQGAPSAKVLSSTTSTTSGGSSNSLADVAMYYYATDLRDSTLNNCTGALGTDVCNNTVAANGADSASWQHMTLFTIGLGAGGSLTYDPNYPTQKAGDYYSILQGTKNWPVPAANMPTAIDDLWHAAVNGRGQYFSVQNAADLDKSLSGTLDQIRAVTGTASAAATSTLQPVKGDNDVFVAQFTTVSWIGDIKKYQIDPASGSISSVAGWSVQAAVELKTPSLRNIFYKPVSGTTPRAFTPANISSDGYSSWFTNFCSMVGASGTGNPTQCSSLASADKTSANVPDNLVNYLRGDQTMSYYRTRDARLGDIINASPVFVGKPRNAYTDAGYSSYVTAQSGRVGVVYAAANDGMLHAFLQSTGEELWAYIPTPMLAKMYKLADVSYANYHDYYVDGTPTAGDVFYGGQWHTILVGGYRAGGSGYYALDITDPANPLVLWEISNINQPFNIYDKDLGLSFGNPIITKNKSGTWVVAFTSGYNNNSGGGDGNGHLYVVRADTGASVAKLGTFTDTAGLVPAGTTSKPSGLAMINDWVDFDTDNTAKSFYGVDLLGNVWRFDIDGNVQPYSQAFLLAQMKDALGNAQPITTKPVLAQVTYKGINYAVVYVATGEYLGATDLSTIKQQSAYAFVDPLTATPYGDIRKDGVLVSKGSGTCASNPVDWSTKKGWYFDFPTTGERNNVNSVIALTTITTATNVPSSDLCAMGGSSFIYTFDLYTGCYIQTPMGATLTVGITVVQLTDGSTVTISTNSKSNLTETSNEGAVSQVNLRRSSWRELE